MKLCYTVGKYGTLGAKLTGKGFLDPKTLLNTDKASKMKNGQTVNGNLLCRGKDHFTHGITSDKKETTGGEIKLNLNQSKRLPPD